MPRTRRSSAQQGYYAMLPNVFTTGNLFLGFFSLISTVNGHFLRAAVLIYGAMIFDFADGPVARFTGASSQFGVEYDSLADALSFGVAPAMLAYLFALSRYDRYGWLVAFLFAAAAALRLGRFNTRARPGKANAYFQGMSTPTASGTLAGLVLLLRHFHASPETRGVVFFVAVPLLAFLMVSSLPYYSFKTVRLTRKQMFYATVGVVVLISAVAMRPEVVLPVLFGFYALSGPVLALWHWHQRRNTPEEEAVDA